MNRKIKPEETNALFRFVHKHYVYHYDLQIELVDHLAASIEEQWDENADLSFEDGLRNTFKKFGITGFSKIKQEKQKGLARKYNLLLWNYLLEFYRWPKMLLTLALTLGLFLLFQAVNGVTWILVPYFVILLIGGYIYFYKFAKKSFEIKTVRGKKFMLLEQLKQFQMAAILFCQLPVQSNIISRELDLRFSDNIWVLLVTAFLVVSFNIVMFGYFFYIPKKIKEHFMTHFAEFAV